MPADAAQRFDLDAGIVCLDFANTEDSSGEHLNAYSDVIDFAAQSGLLSDEDAAWFRAEAQRDGKRADGVVVIARRLRTVIYAMFSAVASGKPPRESDVDRLNAFLAASMAHARVLPGPGSEGSYRWGWSGRNMEAPLWGVIRSAADLLTEDAALQRVRQCGGANCRWLFLDT